MFLKLLPLQRFQLHQASPVPYLQEQAPETQCIWFRISNGIVKNKQLQKITFEVLTYRKLNTDFCNNIQVKLVLLQLLKIEWRQSNWCIS
jgi:hypothetical protein